MSVWASKDPDAVQDRSYTIPLDAGDAVASHSLDLLAGTVVIDDESIADAVVTAWLSGGADGETSVFRIAWTTTAGREDDDVITLAVASHEYEALVLTGYVKPSPQHLRQRYPAFADIDAGTIQFWLTDAERYVTDAWGEGDYAAGLMALAAHNMTLAGYGTDAASVASIPAGITSMKSGTLSLSFSDQAANARAGGGYDATRYGQEYKALLLRNRGGPLVAPTGIAPYGLIEGPDFV
jgi:hypothetical protein